MPGSSVRKEITSENLTEAGIAAKILDYSILGGYLHRFEFAQGENAVVNEPALFSKCV